MRVLSLRLRSDGLYERDILFLLVVRKLQSRREKGDEADEAVDREVEEKKQSELPLARIECASVKSLVCSLFSHGGGENSRIRE